MWEPHFKNHCLRNPIEIDLEKEQSRGELYSSQDHNQNQSRRVMALDTQLLLTPSTLGALAPVTTALSQPRVLPADTSAAPALGSSFAT